MSAYREHGGVAGAVAWSSGPLERPRRVVPDGCIDILLVIDGEPATGEVVGAGVVGTMTRAIEVQPSRWSYLAARFEPGGVAAALGVPAAALTDQRVPLGDLGLRGLWSQVGEGRGIAGRLERLAGAMAPRLAPPPPPVRRAVARILASGGALGVEELAAEIGVTRQHLARAFAQHVGISPKQLARVVRLERAMELARRGRDWAELAPATGYFDQSHLANDFHRLVGLSPEAWRRSA